MHNSKHEHAVNRLSTLIEHLHGQALATDEKNSMRKSHKLVENNDLFSPHLFSTQSDKISLYVDEVKTKLSEFSRLSASSNTSETKAELAQSSLEHIEQQISSIYNALQANQSMHQAAQTSFDIKKRVRINSAKKYQQAQKQKYNKMAEAVLLSSHQLYEQLNEHHEFERRLLEMITDREQQRSRSRRANIDQISQEILTLHQRLGRCRKAISTIERNIEVSEQKNR